MSDKWTDRLSYLITKYQPFGAQSYGPLTRLLDC